MQTSATRSSNPWPQIDPAKLCHQIVIEQQGSARDAAGQIIVADSNWTAVRTTMGGLNSVSMREAFAANQLTSQGLDIWTVRWTDTAILPGMRIVFGSQRWKIEAVNDYLRRHLIVHLLCLTLNASS